MFVMSCPWCDEEVPTDLRVIADEYRCAACGTCVLLADAEEDVLELAA